jgi:hypothetical protein
MSIVLLAGCCAVACGAGGGGQPAGGSGSIGKGLTVKDFVRVEQGRGDAGGLSHSLARGPATTSAPNDFSGVYQIPEDADSPYAGWYARVSGAMIAVFPRGEYVASREGARAAIPANTRFFIGSVPLNARGGGGGGGAKAKPENGRVGAVNERVDYNTKTAAPEPVIERASDAPMPVTMDTATDVAGVRSAMAKLCGDPVYRTNRVRELVERAERSGGTAGAER